MIGYKLASPSTIQKMEKMGKYQIIPVAVTVSSDVSSKQKSY